MSMRKPVVIQSLEEDFRRIGLLSEETQKPAHKVDDDPENIDEVRKTRMKKRRGVAAKKKAKMSKRWRKSHKGKVKASGKKWRRSSRGKKSARMQKKAPKAQRGFRRSFLQHRELPAGMERISALIGEVHEVLGSLSEDDDTMKGFANIAAITDLLSRKFESMQEEFEIGEDLDEVIEILSDVAKASAEIAEALGEGTDTDFSELEEEFKDMITITLEGLELYNELSEEDDLDDDDLDDDDLDEDDDEGND